MNRQQKEKGRVRKIYLMVIVSLVIGEMGINMMYLSGCGKDISEKIKLENGQNEENKSETGQQIKEKATEGKFYYQQLGEKEKKAYTELLEGIQNMDRKIRVDMTGQKELEKMNEAMVYDMPQLFWYSGSWRAEMYSDYTEIYPEYTCDAEKRVERQKEIDETAEKCLRDMKKCNGEYEKIKYVFEYLVNTVEYDPSATDNQNLYSALKGKHSVCAGYAKAAQYLLEKSGIECIYVTGTTNRGEAHAWNIVKCNGKYYHFDATWGDPLYQEQEDTEQTGKEVDRINYDYLCCDDESIRKEHTIGSFAEYPVCDSDDLNYFRLNNMYYESYDAAALLEKMKESYEKKEDSFTCEFSNPDVYAQAREDIINNLLPQASQKLAQYYGFSQVRYSYSEYAEHYRITVYWQYSEYTGN